MKGDRERSFVDAYFGAAEFNATVAARIAGYENPVRAGMELVTKPSIQSAMAQRAEGLAVEDKSVASKEEYARFLSSMMRGEELDVDRHGTPIAPKAGDRQRAGQALAALFGWESEKGPTTAVQVNNYGRDIHATLKKVASRYLPAELDAIEEVMIEERN